jgi:hypothetical protein
MDNLNIIFNISNFGLAEGFFTFFYLALSCAIFYLIRFFESKARTVLDVNLFGIYVLLILPMMLNIFNMWCLSEFLIVSEKSKTWTFVAVSTIIVATGIFTLNKILRAIEVRDQTPTAKISLKKEEN